MTSDLIVKRKTVCSYEGCDQEFHIKNSIPCNICCQAFYCSQEHLSRSYEAHKSNCFNRLKALKWEEIDTSKTIENIKNKITEEKSKIGNLFDRATSNTFGLNAIKLPIIVSIVALLTILGSNFVTAPLLHLMSFSLIATSIYNAFRMKWPNFPNFTFFAFNAAVISYSIYERGKQDFNTIKILIKDLCKWVRFDKKMEGALIAIIKENNVEKFSAFSEKIPKPWLYKSIYVVISIIVFSILTIYLALRRKNIKNIELSKIKASFISKIDENEVLKNGLDLSSIKVNRDIRRKEFKINRLKGCRFAENIFSQFELEIKELIVQLSNANITQKELIHVRNLITAFQNNLANFTASEFGNFVSRNRKKTINGVCMSLLTAINLNISTLNANYNTLNIRGLKEAEEKFSKGLKSEEMAILSSHIFKHTRNLKLHFIKESFAKKTRNATETIKDRNYLTIRRRLLQFLNAGIRDEKYLAGIEKFLSTHEFKGDDYDNIKKAIYHLKIFIERIRKDSKKTTLNSLLIKLKIIKHAGELLKHAKKSGIKGCALINLDKKLKYSKTISCASKIVFIVPQVEEYRLVSLLKKEYIDLKKLRQRCETIELAFKELEKLVDGNRLNGCTPCMSDILKSGWSHFIRQEGAKPTQTIVLQFAETYNEFVGYLSKMQTKTEKIVGNMPFVMKSTENALKRKRPNTPSPEYLSSQYEREITAQFKVNKEIVEDIRKSLKECLEKIEKKIEEYNDKIKIIDIKGLAEKLLRRLSFVEGGRDENFKFLKDVTNGDFLFQGRLEQARMLTYHKLIQANCLETFVKGGEKKWKEKNS